MDVTQAKKIADLWFESNGFSDPKRIQAIKELRSVEGPMEIKYAKNWLEQHGRDDHGQLFSDLMEEFGQDDGEMLLYHLKQLRGHLDKIIAILEP